MAGNERTCPKCRGTNISYQVVQTESAAYTTGKSTVRTKGSKGCLYWLFIGWWMQLLFFPFKIIRAMFPRRGRKVGTATHNTVTRTETNTKTIAVCQNCGYSWTI